MVHCCFWWRPRWPESPSTADRTAEAPALLAWRERLDGLSLSSEDKDALIRLLLAMQPADREVVVITDVQMVADALRRHPAAQHAGPSGVDGGAAMAGAKPQQDASKTGCYVKVHINAENSQCMDAMALVDTGFTRDLLLSEYKATQLGLQRDGHVVIAAAAGGSILMLRRYGAVDVAVCVHDESGQESHINQCILECWAVDDTSDPDPTVQSTTPPSTVLSANCFTNCASTVAASSQTTQAASPEQFCMLAHETKAGVYRISPIGSGEGRPHHDIRLGRTGMMKLGLNIDKLTGDMICSLHGPDALLTPF